MALAALLAALTVPAARGAESGHRSRAVRTPKTVVLDGERMARTKARLQAGDPGLERALRDLTARADAWLGQGPWTVTDMIRTTARGPRLRPYPTPWHTRGRISDVRALRGR